MKKPPVFIDLFSGCGGLSLGLLSAGWKGIFAVERTADAFKTYSHNLIDSGRFEYDWPSWLPQSEHDVELLLQNHRENLASLEGTIDLIAGGPPCQGFSPAGKRNPKDPRNRMAERYIEVVRLVKPKFLLLENVRGFNAPFKKSGAGKKSVPYSQVVKRRLEKEGYKVEFRVIVSAEWGVPQLRPRFILIATRKDLGFKWDPFTKLSESREFFHTSRGLDPNKQQITCDAIDDLKVQGKELIDSTDGTVKGFKQILYKEQTPSSSFIKLMRADVPHEYVPNSLRLPRHRSDVAKRFALILDECARGRNLTAEQRERYGIKKHSLTPLCPDRPSATMTTLPDDFLHYSEPRILTVREMARIQSFPDWFELLGQYTTGGAQRKTSCPRYTQVGNAVPPLLGEALAELLINAYKELRFSEASFETGKDTPFSRNAHQGHYRESFQPHQ
ncbi:DNA (cytosine-5-)-methyltransferase [Pseudomonas fluorescens]|nr:DNA (cytosine-5-)-methyltransferase [Pseudomonas fluorescens]OPB14925.1 DNA (cytosine-5-)-methyltransferase [Pseudomonas fluorescens]OPB28426.1 DNA (cytosine-5-)-methyltransferase [Pseudomonas fluorescens]